MARHRRVQASAHVESWRANIPLFRAVGTSASILLSVAWLTWQGSQWVADMKNEMRDIRNTLTVTARTLETKAEKDAIEFRFALLCAKAPPAHKGWACSNT